MLKVIANLAALYGLYLIGQDVTVWLMGGQSITGLFAGSVDQYEWIHHYVSPHAGDVYFYVSEKWQSLVDTL